MRGTNYRLAHEREGYDWDRDEFVTMSVFVGDLPNYIGGAVRVIVANGGTIANMEFVGETAWDDASRWLRDAKTPFATAE